MKFFFLILLVYSYPIFLQGNLDWNQFRGATGQGHASSELPVVWDSEGDNLLWRTKLEGKAWSSPISTGSEIIVSNARAGISGNKLFLEAISIDPKNGKRNWRSILFEHNDLPRIHRKNSYASPTPFYDGNRIYFHFGNLGTACTEKNGQVVWKKTFNYSPVHGSGSSLIAFGELLLFSADGADNPCLYALNKKDGSITWKARRTSNAKKNFSFCTPLVIPAGNSFQIISPASDWCFSYDLTGREIWKSNYRGGYSVVPRPIYHKGIVYVSSGYDHPTLYAIATDGVGEVTKKKVRWSTGKAVPRNSSPLIVNGLLFMVSDAGVVSCLDALTGEVKWMERVAGSTSASLIHASGMIYLTDEEGTTYVFQAKPSFELQARNSLQERTLASAMAYGNTLVMRTEVALYRIGEVSKVKN